MARNRTDDEPPKRWEAAREPVERLLQHFKLGQEFYEHMGWTGSSRDLSLAEQESLAGDIEAFLKTRLRPCLIGRLETMDAEQLIEAKRQGKKLPEPDRTCNLKVDPDMWNELIGGPTSPSEGCTCGAWVTPGARHDAYCDLGEA